MTTPALPTLELAQMPALAELFRMFLAGKHLNRIVEPTLWAELERHESSYTTLFAALGFNLCIDRRGFAWFHGTENNSGINKLNRHLALLFMIIFDAKANSGESLTRFLDWHIDRQWLAEIHEQNREMLEAEDISLDNLTDLLGRANTLGFVMTKPSGWRLLSAVYRYLDKFEELANEIRADDDANIIILKDDSDDASQEEE